MKKALISWSGGKDSCYALMKAKENKFQPAALIVAMNEQSTFTKSNGVPYELLVLQAKKLNLPVETISANWENYEGKFTDMLAFAGRKYNAKYCIFGDVDIESHKDFEEQVSRRAGLKAVLPLWKRNREELAHEILKSGIRAKISVIRKGIIPEKYLGQDYTSKLFNDFKKMSVDLLGENGEFHTLVYNCPLFERSIKLKMAGNYEIENCKLSIFEREKHGCE